VWIVGDWEGGRGGELVCVMCAFVCIVFIGIGRVLISL